MKINSMSNQPEKQANQLTDDEIDLRQAASTLSRHKALIAKISVTTLLFSCIYAITQRPVWEGRFQIVLEDKNKLSDVTINSFKSKARQSCQSCW